MTIEPLLKINSESDIASNSEWKAATVLSGSLVEALLLWALQRRREQVSEAITRIQGRVTLHRANRALEDWGLTEYIEVSAELGIIGAEAAAQCRLARGFRNLIHPGAEQRRAEKCGPAEALTALAAAEHVIRDISRRGLS